MKFKIKINLVFRNTYINLNDFLPLFLCGFANQILTFQHKKIINKLSKKSDKEL